jgi:hypothetical protein
MDVVFKEDVDTSCTFLLIQLDAGSGLVVTEGVDQCTACVGGGNIDVSFSLNLNQVDGMDVEKNFKAYMKVKQASNGDYGRIFFLIVFL